MDSNIIKEAAGIAKLINDPLLIVLTLVILFFLIYFFYNSKVQNKKDFKTSEMIYSLIEEVNHNSQTLVKLTTLIEVLVQSGRPK